MARKTLIILFLCSVCFAPVLKPPKGMVLNHGHPQARGLIFHMLGNEGSGNKVFDLSGNGNEGTIINCSWVPGKFGSALQANGDAAGVNMGSMSILDGLSAMSFVCWARTVESRVGDPYLFRWGDADNFWHVFWDNNDLRSRLDAGGGNTVINGPDKANFAYDEWFQYATTYDGISHKVYFNGVLWDSAALSGAHDISSGSTFWLMTDNSTDKGWEQPYSHAMVYSRALSASQVAEIYWNSFGMFEKDDIALMALEAPAPAPGGGQVIMITSVPLLSLLFIGLYQSRKHKKAA